MRIRLQGGDKPIQAKGDDASAHPHESLVLANALPDQPGPTNLGDRGENELPDVRIFSVSVSMSSRVWGGLSPALWKLSASVHSTLLTLTSLGRP